MNTSAVHTEELSPMGRIESITYLADFAHVTVSHDPAGWHVSNGAQSHDFATVPAWMAYVKATYGWPLALVQS